MFDEIRKFFRRGEEFVEPVDTHPWSQPHIRQMSEEMSAAADKRNHIGVDLVTAYILHTQSMRPDAATIVDALALARQLVRQQPLDADLAVALNYREKFIYALRFMVAYWDHYAKHEDRMSMAAWYVLPSGVRNWCINMLHRMNDQAQGD